MARNLTSAIVSAVVGCVAAFITCLIFFYFVNKPAQQIGAQPQTPTATPLPTPVQEIPNPEIKSEDVRSVKIRTVYKGYFQPGDKCAKSYNEYFGNDDGVASPSSPCTIEITFDRNGDARRSIEVRRWDKTSKDYRVVERLDSTAKITPEQFAALAQTIVNNEAFSSWRQGTMIDVSNCTISVDYGTGTRSPMSNVDERTTVFLQMVNAFRKLEKELEWKNI